MSFTVYRYPWYGIVPFKVKNKEDRFFYYFQILITSRITPFYCVHI